MLASAMASSERRLPDALPVEAIRSRKKTVISLGFRCGVTPVLFNPRLSLHLDDVNDVISYLSISKSISSHLSWLASIPGIRLETPRLNLLPA